VAPAGDEAKVLGRQSGRELYLDELELDDLVCAPKWAAEPGEDPALGWHLGGQRASAPHWPLAVSAAERPPGSLSTVEGHTVGGTLDWPGRAAANAELEGNIIGPARQRHPAPPGPLERHWAPAETGPTRPKLSSIFRYLEPSLVAPNPLHWSSPSAAASGRPEVGQSGRQTGKQASGPGGNGERPVESLQAVEGEYLACHIDYPHC